MKQQNGMNINDKIEARLDKAYFIMTLESLNEGLESIVKLINEGSPNEGRALATDLQLLITKVIENEK